MASIPMSPIGGTMMRFTKLGACGEILTGVGSCVIVSDGFVSVERVKEQEDANEILVPNAAGRLCIKHRQPPQFKWYTFTITFCGVNPELYALVTGSPLVLDDATPTANAVGFRTREGAAGIGSTNFGMEIWSELANETCTLSAQKPYGYYLAPWVSGGMPGDVTWENGAVSFSMTDAITRAGSPWGTGPATYTVRRDAMTGTAEVLLTAITAADHDHMERVTVAPPALSLSCTTLAP